MTSEQAVTDRIKRAADHPTRPGGRQGEGT